MPSGETNPTRKRGTVGAYRRIKEHGPKGAAVFAMNRLHQFIAPEASAATAASAAATSVTAAVYRQPDEDSPCAIFAPLHYEPNYGYPLVVWLHGGGDSERQLRRVMPHVSLRNYVSVAPRGTLAMTGDSGKAAKYTWVQTPDHVSQADHAILRAVAAAQVRFHIRPDRIFLAGYECGGTMALRIAAAHPERFAGALSLCGPFPNQGAPLANLTTVRRLPVYVAACREGTYYPTAQVCDDLRLFHTAGISITLREYPGGDGLTTEMLADVDRWLMGQIVMPEPVCLADSRQNEIG